MERNFLKELEQIINSHSKENGSNTPDFILAGLLHDVLLAFDKATLLRNKWYAPAPQPTPTQHTGSQLNKEQIQAVVQWMKRTGGVYKILDETIEMFEKDFSKHLAPEYQETFKDFKFAERDWSKAKGDLDTMMEERPAGTPTQYND